MAAKISTITIPKAATYDAPREHQSPRLPAQMLATIEDIAKGVEAGDSGLKSCSVATLAAAAAGADSKETSRRHHRDVEAYDDEDACFAAMGDLLAAGFSFAEVRKRVTLSGGATHMLALERWCDRVRLSCDADAERPTEMTSAPWEGGKLHERRRRCERAMRELRATTKGTDHAAVLHIVYGWADPFVNTLPPEVRVALGPEFAPLARYTDVVEAKRLSMVREATSAGSKVYVPAAGCGLRGLVAAAAETDEMLRLAAAHGDRGTARRASITREEGTALFDLERARSLRNWHDRNITSGDALRAAVASFPEAMPVQGPTETKRQIQARKDARKARLAEHRAAVKAFITAVKVDANRMLTEASLAFRAAWQGS